jgi:hypothetical protein
MKQAPATPRFKHGDVVVAGNLVLHGEQSYLIRNLRGAQFSAYRDHWHRWFVLAALLFAAITAGVYLTSLWTHPDRNLMLLVAAGSLFGSAAAWSLWNNFGYTAYIAPMADDQKPQNENVAMFFTPFKRKAAEFCALVNQRIAYQHGIEKLAAEIKLGGIERYSDALDDKLQQAERGELSADDFQQFVRACVDELRR